MTTRLRETLILDDGEYFVVLAAHQPAGAAVGFLERRCAVTSEAPNGRECLGAFTHAQGIGWTARIATEFEPAAGCDHHVVAAAATRLDAIAALWRARRYAQMSLRPRAAFR